MIKPFIHYFSIKHFFVLILPFVIVGCGSDGTVNITVTPSQTANVGETITVKASGDFPSESVSWRANGVSTCSGKSSCDFASDEATDKAIFVSVDANDFRLIGIPVPTVYKGDAQAIKLTWVEEEVEVDTIGSVTQVSTGINHSCALLTDSTISCWGRNNYGQLGDSSTTDSTDSSERTRVDGITSATQVANGSNHTCAVLSGGTVQCWGLNGSGQLGDGTNTNTSTPVTVSGISSAARVSAGGFPVGNASVATGSHSCALLSDSKIQCWGANDYGQLGDGSTTSSLTPVTVSGITNAIEISVGVATSCALLSDRTISCWGRNSSGQLGDGSSTDSSIPVTVSNISSAVDLSVSSVHACALLSNSQVQCWGDGSSGALGNDSFTSSSTPVTVDNISTAVGISVGTSHSCALLSDDTVTCWGDNTYGQLGNGSSGSGEEESTPSEVDEVSSAIQLSGKQQTVCVSLDDGQVQCWGLNDNFQAAGSDVNVTTPTEVLGFD